MDQSVDKASIQVTLAYSPAPREVVEFEITLPQGSTVQDALNHANNASNLNNANNVKNANLPEHLLSNFLSNLIAKNAQHIWITGIFGQKVLPSHLLQNLDRVELYRPLKVDPKVARRERFQKQGARTTGLFAKMRVGGKAGY